MPHNWASAECIRYLRHMLLLEDGSRMRFLEGMIPASSLEPGVFRLEHTPTRFGHVTLQLEPLAKKRGWKLDVTIEPTQRVSTVEIPVSIMGQKFERVTRANFRIQHRKILIDPDAGTWSAVWH